MAEELGSSLKRGSDAYASSVAFFTHSLDAVLFTAPDGRILDANDAACRLLEMDKDEICRRGRAGLADPADPRWAAAVAERARAGRFLGPLSLCRGDGTTIELVVSSAVFTDRDGEARTVTVMRAAETPARLDTSTPNLVLMDPCGVANRPAFVALGEQQCRKAEREHLPIGLLYARLSGTRGAGGTRLRLPSDALRTSFAALFGEDCGWGDVLGRVGENDFAMLVSDDNAGTRAIARSVSVRVRGYNDRASGRLRIHLGGMPVVSDQTVVELLELAAARMHEHVASPHDGGASGCCFFSLNDPSVPLHVDADAAGPATALTARELAVLRLLALHRSNKEIAEALFLSLNTVKTHLSHVYAKLGVTSRQEALAVARHDGLVPRRPTITARAAEAEPAAPPTEPDGHAAKHAPGREEVVAPFGVSSADATKAPGATPSYLANPLASVIHALTAATDADEILDVVMTHGLRGFQADGAIITFIDGDRLVPVAARGYPHESIAAFLPAPIGLQLPLNVAATQRTTVYVASRDEATKRFPELALSPLARSNAWIATPLIAAGNCLGALGISFLEPHEFTTPEREYIELLADLCTLSLRSQRDEPATAARPPT
jgi:DNA-binding CsgD family transcriptional regulator